MEYYDIAIVGAGIIGASIARELSRYDIRTVLLEKEVEPAFGVSKSNSGIVHPGTQNNPKSLKGRLCVEGNRLVRSLSSELGLDFKEVGELIIAFNEEELRSLYDLLKDAKALRVPGVKMVDKKWLRRKEPNLSSEAVAALYAPTAGIISPYRWVYALAANASDNGVDIRTSTKVLSISAGEDNFTVVTSRGDFSARVVINAAGLYADEVARMAGIDDFIITPRKGEEFLLDKKRQYITRHLIFPVPSKLSKGILVTRTADGNPMIGPTAEDVNDKEDLSTTEEGLNRALEGARKLVPGIDERDIIAYFAGLRPRAGDDFIIRSENKVRGFINVAGIQSPGLTAAPAIAPMVIDLIRECGVLLKKKKNFYKYRKKDVHLFSIPLEKTKELIKKDHSYGDIVCRCEMVSAKEIEDAIENGAATLDGIKFRTRAQAGRCHGSFCTSRLLKILEEKKGLKVTDVTKRGVGSEIVKKDRAYE